MSQPQIDISHYDFTNDLSKKLLTNHYVKDLWPLVYILSDGKTKEAYVGETTDTYKRLDTHLKSQKKNKLTSVRLITCDKFNKSATLDIESNLIKYISGDGEFKLLNGNLGLANHNYYQKKELYWDVFTHIWNKLRSEGVAKHSIEHIGNSDLFKYSPYKNLSKDQNESLLQILVTLEKGVSKSILVEGGAGTGKTILAIFLFKLLSSSLDDFNFAEFGEEKEMFLSLIGKLKQKNAAPKMALVVPMVSFRSTLKKVFKNITGLNPGMVISPAEVVHSKYDILVVDEAHRLRRRINLGTYYRIFDVVSEKLGFNKYSCSELDWVLAQSKHTILFYDELQTIKPSDTKAESFNLLKKLNDSTILKLRLQLRVAGGESYAKFVHALLKGSVATTQMQFKSKEYEFVLFDSLKDMIAEIQKREKESGLARLIAGFAWPWRSKKNKSVTDITIEDVQLKWNGTSSDWINSENALQEVGCIHTTQGYDLNYAGIIFGPEISYDSITEEIVIKSEKYFDKNGKQSIKDPEELKRFIINIYQTILLRGQKGTYVYVCDPLLRAYFEKYIPVVKHNNSQSVKLEISQVKQLKNSVPLFDLKVAAGEFGLVQKNETTKWISLPAKYKPSKDLFACQVIGESMNKIIPNGSICLFKRYTGGSRNGLIVLAEHTNILDAELGSQYTVKEYESKKQESEDGWKHSSILLKPLSNDPTFKILELQEDELSTFKIHGIFEAVLQ